MKKGGQKQKIGLFGGTFNPFHNGHRYCIETVREALDLDTVYVIPASKNPHKNIVDGATSAQRFEMLVSALEGSEGIEVDRQELDRGGRSYSIETVRNYRGLFPESEIYWILGVDQFEIFDQWKDFEEILQLVNLGVVYRPGFEWPEKVEDLPKGIISLVQEFDPKRVELKSGRGLYFLSTDGVDVSAARIRRNLQQGESVTPLVEEVVESYINQHGLYTPLHQKLPESETFAVECANWLVEKRAIMPRVFDLRKMNSYTDFTIVVSGQSTRHASSLAESLIQRVKADNGALPSSIEGLKEGRWVVVDYGIVVIHVFYDFVRSQYNLEDLWKAAPEVPIQME